MIKKIFSYIVIFVFLFIPSLSFAKIIEINTVNVNQSDITTNSVKIFGYLYQSLDSVGGQPKEVSAGFAGPIKSSQPITSCNQLPKAQLTKIVGANDEPNSQNPTYYYGLTKTITNLEDGATYYFCFAAIEGKDNKDSNQYSYGAVRSFSAQPALEIKANTLLNKAEINYGGTVNLTWESKGANVCFGKNDLASINIPNNNGIPSIPTSGSKTLDKIYQRKLYTIECLSPNGGFGTITKSVEVVIKGKDENKIGKVVTLPTDKKTEPEVTVEVTDKSAKLKGKLESLFANVPTHCKNGVKDGNETEIDVGGSCINAYAYFRISKVTIPPLFCNDIFGSNMIAVTANSQGGKKIKGGIINTGEFSGSIDTLEPDTEYAYCAIVSNHPTIPTEIEYGQVVRFRTNPCLNCPHTSIRTLRPTKLTNNSAVLQGSFNSTRNIKVWFEYRPKWGGQYVPTSTDGGNFEADTGKSTFLNDSKNILKTRVFGLNTLNSYKFGFLLAQKLLKKEVVNADLEIPQNENEWHKIADSETIYNKKRNYGRKQFTLTGLSRDTIYQYKIVAETVQNTTIYPNPNPVQKFEGAIVEFRTKTVSDGTNPLAHCFNGIQDLGETGIDIGGGCPSKKPSCTDGIKNQDETGIDTGGVCEKNTIDHCVNGIQDFGETGIDTGGVCDESVPDCPEGEVCDNENCPTGFHGTYGNCIPNNCPAGYGGIPTDNKNPPTGCIFIPALPNCNDKIQNQDETGVDIGGVCGGLPASCYDGILNGDETGIDTGGKCGNGPKEKVTVNIKADPQAVEVGGRSTISWTSTNATSCIVSGYGNGKAVATSGEFSAINITTRKSFTATCTGENGTASDSVTIFTYPKNELVSANISATPSYINTKGNVTVKWSSTNATSCVVHGKGIEGKTQLQNELGIPNIDKSTTWSIECVGQSGTKASDTTYVYVGKDNSLASCYDGILNGDETGIDTGGKCGNGPKEKVTVNIKADPQAVEVGGRSTISWTSTNATSCIVSGYGNGKAVATSGEFSAINITTRKSFTATCTGENGTASDSVTIFTYPKNELVSANISATPSYINTKGNVTVKWSSTNATSCVVHGKGIEGKTQLQNELGIPNIDKSTTWSIECVGQSGTKASDTTYVYVGKDNSLASCYDGILNGDETGIDTGGKCGNGGGGNNNNCPEGWLQTDGSCVPTYTCPKDSTGIWPNCSWTIKPTPCPTSKGWSGVSWPDCKYNGEIITWTNDGGNNTACPTGANWTGEKWPDCKYTGPTIPCPKSKGWSGVSWPDCKYNGGGNNGTGNICPSGYSGTPPNCKIVTSECPTGWTGTYPNCKFTKECPEGTTGTYPNCKVDNNPTCPNGGIYPNCVTDGAVCPSGYSGTPPNCSLNPTCPVGYTGNPPTCVASTSCPTNWQGTWPNCKFIGDDGEDGNGDNTCPLGSTGTWPNCKFSQTCPAGFTGTWPVCTSGPTTNIAHCSNGVQDFGETAIDIGGGCGGVYNSGASCFDNIKNGDETGIDTGGHCGDGPNNNGEYPSCFDNIKNGDETGIDTGGHCGDSNTGIDWVDVIFPDNNGTGITTGTCANGICDGDWEGNFPGLDGPISGSCRAGQYTDCTFEGNCVDGVCNGTWDGNFPGQNGPFAGTINGGLGDGRGLDNNDWLDGIFLNLAGEGILDGNCVNGICSGEFKGICIGVNGPLTGIWNAESATGPYVGTRENNKCSGKWNGVIAGNNGELIGKWKGDGKGINDGKELYIGYEGIPDVDDIVRYHEGIEHVFIRRIMLNTELARHYGYQKGQNLLHFAWDLAHKLAKEFGYVDNEGKEIRVSQPDVSAYQLRLVGEKITVYEYYKNKIIDQRDRTTIFKNKNSYEYYFVK